MKKKEKAKERKFFVYNREENVTSENGVLSKTSIAQR